MGSAYVLGPETQDIPPKTTSVMTGTPMLDVQPTWLMLSPVSGGTHDSPSCTLEYCRGKGRDAKPAITLMFDCLLTHTHTPTHEHTQHDETSTTRTDTHQHMITCIA
jgi:hypothetical protein